MIVIFDMFETLITHYHNHGPLDLLEYIEKI